LERKFLKIFIVVVGAGAVVGIFGNIFLDIAARSDANEAVVRLAELAEEGKADAILKVQQFQRRLLYSPPAALFLKPLYDATVRFSLLARELKGATPVFDTEVNKERIALLGDIYFIRDGETLFSQKAIMLNYQDRDRGNHWLLDSWLDVESYVERMKARIEGVTEESVKKSIRQRIGNPPPMVVAGDVKKACKEALARLDGIDPFKEALPAYPGKTPEKLIARFRAKPEEIIKGIPIKVKGALAYIEDEKERQEIERAVRRWRKGWTEGAFGCDELFLKLKDVLKDAKEGVEKSLKDKVEALSKEVAKKKEGFISGLLKKAVEKGAKKEDAEAVVARCKKGELTLKDCLAELTKLVPQEKTEWFGNFTRWEERKFRLGVRSLVESKLLASLLGWRDCFKSEYAKRRISELIPGIEDDGKRVEALLEELISPRLRYAEAVFEFDSLMSNFSAKKREIIEHIRSAIKAVEDDSVRKELLSSLEEVEKKGIHLLEKFMKEKLRPKGVSVHPYDRYAGQLPYSTLISPLLGKQTAVVSEAVSLLRQIRSRKDFKRKRMDLLIGNDKETPPLPGLIHWLLSDALFPDDIRESLLKVMDGILISDTASVEPLIEEFRKACGDERVVRRAKFQALKGLLERLPASEVKLKWQRRLEGRMKMWKPEILALLRRLRGVSNNRELTRMSFPMVLRGIVLRPETLTHDHIALIRDYAKRAYIEIHKRRYALREQTAKTESPSVLYDEVEPLITAVRSLDATEPFYPEKVVNEIEKIAEKHLLPMDETKRRLAQLYKKLLFAGDGKEDFEKIRGELFFLKENLEGYNLEEFNRVVEDVPFTWRTEILSLIERSIGVSAYTQVLKGVAQLRDGLQFDYEKAKEEVRNFIDSEEFLHRSAFETLRQRVLKAVIKDDKNAESVKDYEAMRRRLTELSGSKKSIDEMQKELTDMALKETNVRLNFIQQLSDLVRGTPGLNEDTSHYLLSILEDSVWGRKGCSPEAAREALIKDVQEKSVLYRLRTKQVTRKQRIEGKRREGLDGEVEYAIEDLLRRMLYLSNQVKIDPKSRELVEDEFKRLCSEEAAEKIMDEFSKRHLYLSAIYEVDDWRRRGAIRRAYVELVDDKFRRIRETARKLLEVVEGKEEEEIDEVSAKVVELCFELRRIKEGEEHRTYDILFLQRMRENWSMEWIAQGFVKHTDSELLIDSVERQLKERATLLGVKVGW